MTDLLGAEVCLAPIHSSATAAEVAVVLFDEWYCENGLMRQIISDRDPLFTSDPWAALHKLTGVKLRLSTAYHPQTDGASERTNKTVNQCLRFYVECSQQGWVKALPLIRFNIMNSINKSTGFSGFQLQMGRSPQILPPLLPHFNPEDNDEIAAMEII